MPQISSIFAIMLVLSLSLSVLNAFKSSSAKYLGTGKIVKPFSRSQYLSVLSERKPDPMEKKQTSETTFKRRANSERVRSPLESQFGNNGEKRRLDSASTPKKETTLLTSGEKRDFIQKIFKKRQFKQMMKEETEQVIRDNYAKKDVENYRDNYRSSRRQRKQQRGLTGKEEDSQSQSIDTVINPADTAKVISSSSSSKQATVKPLSKKEASSSSLPTSAAPTPSSQKLYTIMKSPPSSPALPIEEIIPDRPFTLPPGKFRPKQSLGQNYLSDQNYVNKIISTFRLERLQLPSQKEDLRGKQVIEIGPGIGAITRSLFPLFPEMVAVEIDERAVQVLTEKLPGLKVQHGDILQFQFDRYVSEVLQGQKVSIVANLPYHIVSQVLFALADAHKVIDLATVTTQLEVAERITAKPNHKDYGIPSVVLQLYGKTKFHFKIPPTVFFPVPKVDSALISIDFTKPHPELARVDKLCLRKVVSLAFRQRRKMLRKSLKELLDKDNLTLPTKWEMRRPESLTPVEFIHLTIDLYGEKKQTGEAFQKSDDYVWRNVAF